MTSTRALDLDLEPQAHADHELRLNVHTYGMAQQYATMRETVYLSIFVAPVSLSTQLTPDEARVLANQLLQVADQCDAHRAEREAAEAAHAAELEDEEARASTFGDICDELRQAEELGTGGSACYYAHPDVHYVAPDQVAAKIKALQASGAQRWLVVPDPARRPEAGAQAAPPPYPSRALQWP